MDVEQIHDVLKRIESAAWPDSNMAASVVRSVNSAFPDDAEAKALEPATLDSTDAALHLVSLNVPNWSVELQGYAHEPGSRWTCTLREGTVSDDDELIGIGKGPTPPLALLAALLRIALIRATGSW